MVQYDLLENCNLITVRNKSRPILVIIEKQMHYSTGPF